MKEQDNHYIIIENKCIGMAEDINYADGKHKQIILHISGNIRIDGIEYDNCGKNQFDTIADIYKNKYE